MENIESKLNPGDSVKLFGKTLRVCVTPNDKSSCNECQIHHLCNREPEMVSKLARTYECANCTELIGTRRHFKILL